MENSVLTAKQEGSLKIKLPFSGFYESVHSMNIDDAIEQGFNYNHETEEEQEVPEAVYSADVDYDAIHLEYCKKYVDEFAEEFELSLEFDEATSPREYNFSTDKIYCLAKREQIDPIRKLVEADKNWPDFIKENFTDRDGFWSFVSNDYQHEDWTKETLTEDQYEVVIRYWVNNIRYQNYDNFYDWEIYAMDDAEVYAWDSVQTAYEVIDKYIKEHPNATN